jgi:hypothetical protein
MISKPKHPLEIPSSFTLEELYGVEREEYCKITGITPLELIKHLEAEVGMLQKSYDVNASIYRESALYSCELKYFEKLLYAISKRIASKKAKILSLRNIVV